MLATVAQVAGGLAINWEVVAFRSLNSERNSAISLSALWTAALHSVLSSAISLRDS